MGKGPHMDAAVRISRTEPQKFLQKIDKNNNHIQVISNRFFKEYINGKTIENPIFKLFKKFNKNFAFGKWIPADYAIKKMKDSNFYQWKGTE